MDMRYEWCQNKKAPITATREQTVSEVKAKEAEVPAHIVLYLQLWQYSQHIESQMADTNLQIETRLFLAIACLVLRG
jgi:hypothetical protein